VTIGQTFAEMWRFFDFSKWGRHHLGFLNFRSCSSLKGEEGQTGLIRKPNFGAISQAVAKIERFFDFSTWRPPLAWIF